MKKLNILSVQSSARREASSSRRLSADLIRTLDREGANLRLATRDLADGVPFVDEEWVGANFTPPENRTARQSATLAYSDELIAELEAADVILIGVPLYNFGIPASLKAWIDMVTRARKTFQYTENGPVGLLTGKHAVLVVASGGVEAGSDYDFATSYLKHVLGFIGVTDVTVIAADRQAFDADGAFRRAVDAIPGVAKSLANDIFEAA